MKTAIVVTRMNEPLAEVVDSLRPHFDEITFVRGHDGVAERWQAAERCRAELIYTQDDDVIVDIPAFMDAVENQPGMVGSIAGAPVTNQVVCNMPESHRRDYPDGIALVGWGCLFNFAWMDAAFRRYWVRAVTMRLEWNDDIFRREADRVFTGLSDVRLVDTPFRHLERAHGADRMGREARHGSDLKEIRRRIALCR